MLAYARHCRPRASDTYFGCQFTNWVFGRGAQRPSDRTGAVGAAVEPDDEDPQEVELRWERKIEQGGDILGGK